MKRKFLVFLRNQKTNLKLCCMVFALSIHGMYGYLLSGSRITFVLVCAMTLFAFTVYLMEQMGTSGYLLETQGTFLAGVVCCGAFGLILGCDTNSLYIKSPSALDIVIDSVFDLGSFPAFYLVRFFNVLVFSLLVYFAVRIASISKNLRDSRRDMMEANEL